jgi:hypothetical protein
MPQRAPVKYDSGARPTGSGIRASANTSVGSAPAGTTLIALSEDDTLVEMSSPRPTPERVVRNTVTSAAPP